MYIYLCHHTTCNYHWTSVGVVYKTFSPTHGAIGYRSNKWNSYGVNIILLNGERGIISIQSSPWNHQLYWELVNELFDNTIEFNPSDIIKRLACD